MPMFGLGAHMFGLGESDTCNCEDCGRCVCGSEFCPECASNSQVAKKPAGASDAISAFLANSVTPTKLTTTCTCQTHSIAMDTSSSGS